MNHLRLIRHWLAILLLSIVPVLAHAGPPAMAIGFYLPVVRDVPRKDVEVTLRFWIEEIANSMGLTYEPIQFYDDLAVLKRDVQAGKINYVVATAMGLVQHFADDELADGFSGVKLIPDHLLFVVRRDAGINKLQDLAGRRVQLLDRDELSEIYLETLLMQGGLTERQLKSVQKQKKAGNLVLKLFFDQGDAALITRNAFEVAVALNPQIGARLKVLDAYTFKGQAPTIALFSSKLSAEHRELITSAALKLDKSARGRQVLEIYQTDALVRKSVSELRPYRQLLATHDMLKAKLAGAKPNAANE